MDVGWSDSARSGLASIEAVQMIEEQPGVVGVWGLVRRARLPQLSSRIGRAKCTGHRKLQLRDDSEGKLLGHTHHQRYKTDAHYLHTRCPNSSTTPWVVIVASPIATPPQHLPIFLASIAELTSSHRQHAHTPCLCQRAQRSSRTTLRRHQFALLHSSCRSTKPRPSPGARRRQARRRRSFQREATRIPRRAYHGPEAAGATRESVLFPQSTRRNASAGESKRVPAKILASLTFGFVGDARAREQDDKKKGGALKTLIYGTPEGRELDHDIERSFSQVLARGKYVHSIVFHEVKPEKVDEYTELVGKWYPKMASLPDNKVHLVGSWRTEVGDCDTFGEYPPSLPTWKLASDRSLQ